MSTSLFLLAQSRRSEIPEQHLRSLSLRYDPQTIEQGVLMQGDRTSDTAMSGVTPLEWSSTAPAVYGCEEELCPSAFMR